MAMNKLSVPMVRRPALPAPEESHDQAKGALRDAGLLTAQEATRLGPAVEPRVDERLWMGYNGQPYARRFVASDIHRDSCER